MTILDLLFQDGIAFKKVATTNGGEYASPCPACGGSDRFRSWPEQAGGRWWCRGCGSGGDLIQYLRDMRGLSFRDACQFLGHEPGPAMLTWNRRPAGNQWRPRESTNPSLQWSEKATAFIAWSKEQLWSNAGTGPRQWLQSERGLTVETIKAFSLGWNPKDSWRERSSWGLDENGKKLWLPRGLVIPCGGKVKIRRPDPQAEPRYYLLPGSSVAPFVIQAGAAVMVLESELDAVLVHQAAGEMVTCVALGSASIRPDQKTHDLLTGAEIILVSLDNDEAGAKAAWQWWMRTYPQAKRWPPIKGKDPGEMFQARIELKTWVQAGLRTQLGGQNEKSGHHRQRTSAPSG